MPSAADILNTLRAFANGVVVAVVLLGPVGLGPANALASADTCGVSCPCEEESSAADHHDEGETPDGHRQEAEGCAHDTGAAHGAGEPCGDECPADECPDDCPNCHCCPGVIAAVTLSNARANTAQSVATYGVARVSTPANGAESSIFRPPRSLT